MDCEDVRAHIADSLADPSATAGPELAAHLRSCRTCARELEEVRHTWHSLESIPGEPHDSAAMRARFDRALADHVRASIQKPAVAPRPNGFLFARSIAWPVVQIGLAASLLLAGVLLGRQTQSPPPADPQIAALRQELRDMRQMVTLSLMQQQSASDRLKGVSWSGRIDQPGSEVVTALLDTLMHDPNVNVRLASIDALRRFAEREGVRRGAVDALSRQTSPLVQIALIDFLVEVAGRESTATFRGLSQDPMLDRAVRDRAAWALQQVS
jgi:hypothetical protein